MGKVARIEARLRSVDLRTVDAVAAAVLGVVVVATEISQLHAYVVVPVGLVLSATVALRRRRPITATLVAGAAAAVIAQFSAGPLAVSPIVLALDYYMVGRRRAGGGSVFVDAVLLAVPIAAIAIDPNTPSPGNPLIVDVVSVWVFFLALPFAAGRAARTHARLNGELRANAELLAGQQRERAREAVIEERARIARELHDVVAHSVSVMVIQTAAARAVAVRDRAAAIDALRSVESCGREALIDMRRMIGVIHRGDIELLGGAAPGIAQLDTLVDRACASGLPVQISVEGEQRVLSAGLDLVSFRIVQEALTNAIKHAGKARAEVRVTFTTDCLELEIADTGRGVGLRRAPDGARGHGLVGMRERLSLYGGQLSAGHRRGGGFRVLARIPLTDAATR